MLPFCFANSLIKSGLKLQTHTHTHTLLLKVEVNFVEHPSGRVCCGDSSTASSTGVLCVNLKASDASRIAVTSL